MENSAQFTKTEGGMLKTIIPQDAIVSIQSRPEIEKELKICQDNLARLEGQVEIKKAGVEALELLLQKCDELDVGQTTEPQKDLVSQ